MKRDEQIPQSGAGPNSCQMSFSGLSSERQLVVLFCFLAEIHFPLP
jgi:hypothetical protein